VRRPAGPFDLTRGPLFRGMLLRVAEGDHVLALSVHHIISDGWSMGILIREVTALYQAFLEEKPSPLPELPIQYADFAVWQRNWLHPRGVGGPGRALAPAPGGAPPPLDLPGARPRPAALSPRGAARQRRFPHPCWSSSVPSAAGESATLFMALLAPLPGPPWLPHRRRRLVVGTDVGRP